MAGFFAVAVFLVPTVFLTGVFLVVAGVDFFVVVTADLLAGLGLGTALAVGAAGFCLFATGALTLVAPEVGFLVTGLVFCQQYSTGETM